MRFHREGIPILRNFFLIALPVLTVAAFLSMILFYVLLPIAVGLLLFFLQFFRNPVRTVNPSDKLIYAPADGKVVVIEQVFEPEFLQKECLQVSVFMSVFNVHANRAPVSGTVSYLKYHPGKYLVAWHPKSSTENERTSIAIRTSGGDILLRQIAGALAKRIKYYIHADQTLTQGQEIGFIRFGSRVDLFLPLNTQIEVKIGDKVFGNQSVIGRFA
jgi:phosphatidylserine decarboxylase